MKNITRDDIRVAIAEFCEGSSRQRKDLYIFLNKKFGINLNVYNYQGTGDYARFEFENEVELQYIINKVEEKLKEKYSKPLFDFINR